ncbi:hypothetical protein [Methylobacterium sp. ARG-1]|uniref:hypothetical protein n=1 Tax=Methylobacterium sp. ARG-1 TaxID=1692501 RepID=UPI0011875962|nr:hypothetical protein [Methylobacterium sp. ARG-1]
MDNVFWYGIAIGAILSLIASIAANLLNNKIQIAFDRGRRTISQRRLNKLKSNYRLIRGLKSGRIDKTSFFVIGSTISILSFQISIFAVSFALYLANKYSMKDLDGFSGLDLKELARELPALALLTGGIVLSAMGSVIFTKIILVASYLDRFDVYETDLKRTYPQIFADE